ncbi:AlpA family phage regulatory protein [Cronobacter dublinensis]|uniref:AlpA family phage regulatory protein n=1 Tax=Cronobacter dublinensis TaxID=413497 RepID=UPI0039C9D51C
MAPYHLLRIKQVEARTRLHRSQIYAWMKEGHFPQSIKKDPPAWHGLKRNGLRKS